jgi:phosphopantothenoylcysteine synthetase/decarboxylase
MTRNVILGISGSIAAFRAADIASQLTKLGCSVTAVMTADAQEFITPLTLKVLSRNPVVTSLYNEKDSWHPGHIQLADAANLLLIAPATANILAKLAHGIADDALSAIALATRAPILIAPAMNGHMWLHPATVRNTATLRSWGHQFIGPDDGLLSCGYEGIGRLSPVTDIVNHAIHLLSQSPTPPPNPPQPL